MLHVNDDMDELFRKAAENYPLNTAVPDWEQLQKKIKDLHEEKPIRKRKNKLYWFLIFVILLLIIPIKILFNDIMEPEVTATSKMKEHKVNGTIAETRVGVSPALKQIIEKDITINKTKINTNTSNKISNIIEPFKDNGLVFTSPGYLIVKEENKDKKNLFSGSKLHIAIESPEQVASYLKDNNNLRATPYVSTTTNINRENKDLITGKLKGSGKGNNDTILKKDKQRKTSVARLYAGIIGGIDYSTVKLQPVKKMGYGFGVVTGYEVKKWSIETGFIMDKKYYSTDGKHFSTKNIQGLNYDKINRVKGACYMLEIPLNIRYNLKDNGSIWFASVGASSYLMYKENYKYDIIHYGSTYTKEATYDKLRNSFMSVINVSGGYIHKFRKTGELRFEPYIKLPVKKVGIGSLPIQSGGINIVYTKTIF